MQNDVFVLFGNEFKAGKRALLTRASRGSHDKRRHELKRIDGALAVFVRAIGRTHHHDHADILHGVKCRDGPRKNRTTCNFHQLLAAFVTEALSRAACKNNSGRLGLLSYNTAELGRCGFGSISPKCHSGRHIHQHRRQKDRIFRIDFSVAEIVHCFPPSHASSRSKPETRRPNTVYKVIILSHRAVSRSDKRKKQQTNCTDVFFVNLQVHPNVRFLPTNVFSLLLLFFQPLLEIISKHRHVEAHVSFAVFADDALG